MELQEQNYILALEVNETAEESSLLSPDQMGGYLVTALFVVINTIVAYIILKKFVFKIIFDVIKKRQSQIEDNINNAKKLDEEAKKNLALSKENLDKVKQEAISEGEEIKKQANKQAELIIQKANENASAIISQAEERATDIRKNSVLDLKDEITDLSVKISTMVLKEIVVNKDELKKITVDKVNSVIDNEVKDVD